MSGRAAVFLDKDGTLVENVPYNVVPSRVRLVPEAGEGLRLLSECGARLVVVSNQSGVAHGRFPESALVGVQDALGRMLGSLGVRLDGFYYCPHHPEGKILKYRMECTCRKPKPGLLIRAAEELDLDLAESWMIGDILDDVQAGIAAGCRTALIANGNETEWRVTPERWPHVIAADLTEAARQIRAAGKEASCR